MKRHDVPSTFENRSQRLAGWRYYVDSTRRLSDDQISERGCDEDGGKSAVRSELKLTPILQKESVMR